MWVDEVNKSGGIYVKEFDKKLPIELKIYDDTSDLGTMTRLLEKLMVEDKVDFILPPVSTAFLYAAAPIANKHGYILMGAEGGSASLNVSLASMPYFFSILNHSEHQVPVLVDVLAKGGVKKAAVIFISDLHGVEYSGAALPQLALAGIDVVFSKSVPPGITDLSPILKEAMKEDVDAFLAFVYPDEGFLALKQATELGFAPDVFLLGPGANFEFFKHAFGKASEGIMSWGAWNEKTSPAAAEFAKRFVAFTGKRENIDWWGHLPYYASLQVLQQAIERTGTINHAKLAECIRNEEFDTVLGKTRFANGTLAAECYTGQLGQWQNGVFEVIGPDNKATAKPVIPRKVGP
ncbi:MAG: amino acid ABC transporter substrate-binding protein [Ignavibacteriales bacterium]